MQARDAVDDGEAQSGARRAIASRARLAGARERLLQPLDVVARNADAAIGDVDDDVAPSRCVVVTSSGGWP